MFIFKVVSKLKATKVALNKWNKTSVGDIHERAKSTYEKVVAL